MRKKRTANEVENDYKKIRLVVETTTVKSIRDIAKEVGLSESEVKTSLARHPRVQKKIMEQLERNRGERKSKEKSEEPMKVQKKAEIGTGNKHGEQNHIVEDKDFVDLDAEFVVIDASIAGTRELKDALLKVLKAGKKIILTSITIRELEKLQQFRDIDAIDARHILAIAAEDQEHFINVLIEEKLETPDDCIIKYCADHKDKVILFTADKTMTLKARMYGVSTKYFKHDKSSEYMLPVVTKMMDKLCVLDFNSKFAKVMVISDGIEYTSGPYELRIEDDVFLARKKDNFITFAHYKITSLEGKGMCKLIFYRRIYRKNQIEKLPEAAYKSFVRDFRSSHL